MSQKDKINIQQLPKHIAIIMDGNGRWAKEKGEDRLFGHLHGVESVRNIVEGCAELGIQYLTLYAFSTENWDRPQYEVSGLGARDPLRSERCLVHVQAVARVIGTGRLSRHVPRAPISRVGFLPTDVEPVAGALLISETEPVAAIRRLAAGSTTLTTFVR